MNLERKRAREREYYHNVYKDKRSVYAAQKYRENPEYTNVRTRVNRLKRFGLTPEDYNKMFLEQDGRCAICSRHQTEFKMKLAVDHNHQNGKVRGLLCGDCNRALGLFRDNSEVLLIAANYLKENSD